MAYPTMKYSRSMKIQKGGSGFSRSMENFPFWRMEDFIIPIMIHITCRCIQMMDSNLISGVICHYKW